MAEAASMASKMVDASITAILASNCAMPDVYALSDAVSANSSTIESCVVSASNSLLQREKPLLAAAEAISSAGP